MTLPVLTATLAALAALAPPSSSALAARAGGCPAACSCADGIELEVACHWGDEQLTVVAQPHRYAKIACDGGELHCERVPREPRVLGLRNASLPSLEVSACRLPQGAIDCAVRALGVSVVDTLYLSAPPAAAATALLPPPPALRSLVLRAADDAEPARRTLRDLLHALAAAPALRRLTVRNVRLLLEPDGFRNAPPLERLELSLDAIDRLPAGAFRGLTAVRELELWRNEIAELVPGALEGLDSLEQLELSSNALRALTAGAFTNAPRLRVLQSIANPLEELASGTFGEGAPLEELTIRECHAVLRLGARALAALPALRAVRLEHCAVRALPPDVLAGSTALRNLSLARNELETLPASLLSDQTNLRRLDLGGNRIKELSAEFFSSLRLLEELNLDGNLIEVLPDQVFSGLIGIKSISVNKNRVQRISRTAFISVATLERLSLADNQLTMKASVPSADIVSNTDSSYFDLDDELRSPLDTLVSLRELRLGGNRIADIFYDWRVLMVYLNILDLANNDFVNIKDTDLDFLSDNITVDLRHNNITTIFVNESDNTGKGNSQILLEDNPFLCDCRLFGLAQRVADERRRGREWLRLGEAECGAPPSLAGVRVDAVPPAALRCELPTPLPAHCAAALVPAAAALELDCDLPLAPADFPDPATHGAASTTLRLRHPPPAGALDALPPHVRVLSLAGLGLRDLPPARPPSSLAELDLSDNRFSGAPLALLAATPTLMVRLAGNPFVCDCGHADDVASLQRLESRVLDYRALRCVGGGALGAVDAARLCAGVRIAALGGALALLGLAAAVGAVLASRYSRELKVFLFARGCWPRRSSDDEADHDRPYDVFVSFSHGDEKFVTEELVPNLERGPRPLRVCVHYRDWAPGDLITTQIARSVERSRRTVVVLSRHFLRSVWGRLEFRAAHVAALRERRARVVVILLGDVAPEDERLDPELRAYLTTNTYVRRDDPWFWEKLRYALPAGPPLTAAAANAAAAAAPAAAKSPAALDVRLSPAGKLVNAAAPTAAAADATAPAAAKSPAALDVHLSPAGKLFSAAAPAPPAPL